MLNAYDWRADRLVRLDTAVDQGPACWIDLVSPSADEVAALEALTGIDIPSRDEMDDVEPSARLYSEDGGVFMIAAVATDLETHDPVKTPVTFILKGGRLVTVRYGQPRSFQFFIARATNKPGEKLATGETIMMGLIEAVIDRYADALEMKGLELDAISRLIFRKRDPNAVESHNLQALIRDIGRAGDFLALIRESLASLQRLLAYHAALSGARAGGKAEREARQTVRLLQRDAAALSELSVSMTSKVTFLMDATLGLINLEQNQIIKIFSVAAVALLPPTLIASIYGMNFEIMPELQWRFGYPAAIVAMILSAALPYFVFRKKRWL
ncbi:magnesium transporter CorA family protein [Brevundimonas diminuta]|uniref:magnesium transporter CorA family protein n=1 Tax=Brevundimonas diminuta TaxID=293 RepID=UPI00320A3891